MSQPFFHTPLYDDFCVCPWCNYIWYTYEKELRPEPIRKVVVAICHLQNGAHALLLGLAVLLRPRGKRRKRSRLTLSR